MATRVRLFSPFGNFPNFQNFFELIDFPYSTPISSSIRINLSRTFSKLTAEFIPGQINVTLAVFSGVPDPNWVVLPSNPIHKQIQQLLGAARKGGFTYSPLQMPSRLGYKGFLISDLTKQSSELIVGPETVKLQTVLLQTIPKAMLTGKFEAFKNRVLKEEITPGKVKAVKRPTKGKQKRYAYPYDAIPWGPPVQQYNNCYNYANNKITNTYAQPGRGSGGRCLTPTDACVRNAAINDGLENLETDPLAGQPVPRAPNGKRHLVALAIDPGQ